MLFRNKIDEQGIITKNKIRLVAKGYSQAAGINFDDNVTPVTRLESRKMLLAYVVYKDFVIYQIDVKKCIFE